MRILKILLYSILTLIAILLIAALFIKKDYKIEKEVTINKPRTDVFDYLKYLKNQDQFSYWATLDSNLQKTYTGTDGTVGFIYAWKGNKDVGQGEQEIAGIKEGEKIDYKIRFKKPMENEMNSYISTEDAGPNATKVKWAMYGTSSYPWNIMNPFMDKLMGGDVQYGLNKLKTVLEK